MVSHDLPSTLRRLLRPSPLRGLSGIGVAVIAWLLSKLFPYRQPSMLGVMLVAQGAVIDKPKTGWDK